MSENDFSETKKSRETRGCFDESYVYQPPIQALGASLDDNLDC